MRNVCIGIVVAAAAVLCAMVTCGAPLKEGPATARAIRMYVIECKLISIDAKGRDSVLSSPMIATVEDRPAALRVGGATPLPPGARTTDDLFEGTAVDLNVYRGEGERLFLDAKMVLTNRQETSTKGIRLSSCGARVVEPITLGQKVTVPIEGFAPGAAKQRFEFLVREPSEDDKKMQPPPGAKLSVRPAAAHASAAPAETPIAR